MKWTIWIFALMLTLNINAQSNITIQTALGAISAIYPNFPKSDKSTFSVAVQLNKQWRGNKSWHSYYRYPTLGLGIYYLESGSGALGQSVALCPQLGFKQSINGKLSLFENGGLGLAMFNKPYNEINNPQNIAVGSKLTAFATAQIGFIYQYNSKLNILAFGGLMHYSNAHVQLPNVGLNVFNGGIGVKYFFKNNSSLLPDTTKHFDKKWHFNLKVALGINEQGSSIIAVNGPKYPIYIASVFLARKF
ncbi:MAG TPA: acyloxyacyl hydrolase, partial [Bacteroidia bacterium]|nr:acyloxyacyl hydrolase [Bacteroidia bacterium]